MDSPIGTEIPRTWQPGLIHTTLMFTSADASGAVPSVITKKAGFDLYGTSGPVSRTSAGLYVAHLGSQFPADGFCGGFGSVLVAGAYSAAVAHDVKVLAYDGAAKTVTFVCCQPGTGAATDPGSGDIVLVNLFFNSRTTDAAQ